MSADAVAAARAETAARLLIEARRTQVPLAVLPEDCRPRTLDEGYAIQDALARLDGRAVKGWKIGCTSDYAQKLLGVDQPFPGRVFDGSLHASPATLGGREFIAVGLEPEFAFRLARDLPPRRKPYARAEVAGAVDCILPACEIVETRFADWLKAGGPSLVADNGCSGGLVQGETTCDWRGFDLARHVVTLSVNGRCVAEGTGAAVLGHPLEALAWLADDRSRRGDGLRRGEIVTTGTCAGIHFLAPGDEAVADFGPLGAVSVRVAAPQEELDRFEAMAEDACSRMYEVGSFTAAAGCYSDAKYFFACAIGQARRAGQADQVARLEQRLDHVRAVYRGQFC
jgi:2-keto-4-pentenoate hydratase